MNAYLTEDDVNDAVVEWLVTKEGCKKSKIKTKKGKERGVDIRARLGTGYFLIECKCDISPKRYEKPPSGIESNFNYVLGQIITRMNVETNLYKYGIGVPSCYKNKFLTRLPWQVCKKLKIHLLFVDNKKRVECFTWKQIKEKQQNSKNAITHAF